MSPRADEPITALFDLSVDNIDDLRGAREAADQIGEHSADGDCGDWQSVGTHGEYCAIVRVSAWHATSTTISCSRASGESINFGFLSRRRPLIRRAAGVHPRGAWRPSPYGRSMMPSSAMVAR